LKIVYFNYLYDLYEGAIGSTIKAVELLNALGKQGHEIKQYWLNAKPDENQSEEQLPSKVKNNLKRFLDRYLHEPNQILKNLKYIAKEMAIIGREKPDLVISRLDVYLFSTWFVTRVYHVPWMVEADSPEVYEYRKFYTHYKKLPLIDSLIERFNVRAARKVFVVSNLIKKYYVDQGGDPRKIVVIPNGADEERIIPFKKNKALLKKYHLSNEIVIGFIGSFHYWHGIDNLMKIMKQILRTEASVKFLLVGSGGVRENDLHAFVKENGVQSNVIFTGLVPHKEMGDYVSIMDIVLAPYPYLDFFYFSPMKLYEYMAAGKAVVASNIGQIAEVVENGVNGLLYEPDQTDKMVSGIRELIRNPDFRQTLGQNARKDIETKHSWAMRGKMLSELCEEVVQNP